MSHTFHRDDATFAAIAATDLPATKFSGALGGDVALNNTASYFDGPSIAQGTSGTWFVSGSVTFYDTGGAAGFHAKLWDGTTVIASGTFTTGGATVGGCIALCGVISNPTGNLRISVRDFSLTTGAILFNYSGNGKDSTITAVQIG